MANRIEEIRSQIALQLAQGIGRVTHRRLVDTFGMATRVWTAGPEGWKGLSWLKSPAMSSLLAGPDWHKVDMLLDVMDKIGGWVMLAGDDDYPCWLGNIPDAPLILYGMGKKAALSNRAIAIVGSRNASVYGMEVAQRLSRDLQSYGFCIVSGLALGIDTAAHRASIDVGGITVAVTGCGIDIPYPRNNRRLARQIVEKGAVISEFPPGTPPEARNFPIRNRIISGLSRAVVVVEASRKSGSLITAAYALEQGREVMAVPGSIFSFKSNGPHWLIKQGARLVESVRDIIDEFEDVAGYRRDTIVDGACHEGARPVDLGPDEAAVFDKLDVYPQHIDKIAQGCGMPVSKISGLLIQMELKNLVQALPGQMYKLTGQKTE